MAKRKPSRANIVATTREVAAWFGVSEDTVSLHWRKLGMPGDDGDWPLQDIARWLAKSFGSRQPALQPTTKPDLLATVETQLEQALNRPQAHSVPGREFRLRELDTLMRMRGTLRSHG